MLSARYRLRRRQAFDQIYQQGRRQSGSVLSITCLPRPEGSSSSQSSQLAVVVSKKVSRHAVGRNRIKRRLRAVIREVLPDLEPGYWIIISARPSCADRSYPDLKVELQRLLKKAGVLKTAD
jgi:ribonuclease P protein component